MRRRAVVASAAVAAALVAAPAAVAAPIVNGTQTTPTKVDARTKQILYYLDLSSGPQEEAFSVRFLPPRFATRGGRAEGESIDGPRKIALQGPGQLGQLVQDPRFDTPCSDRDAAFHGYATGPASVDVILPPNASTTLAVRYLTGRRAPWADGDYRLRFVVEPKLVGTYELGSPFFGRQIAPFAKRTRRTAGPKPDGRLGAHILLSTTPSGTYGEARSPRRIRQGRRVRISGRLLPSARGRRIDVQVRSAGGKLKTLSSVRTDSRGRFKTTWTPRATGVQEVWARYPTQQGGLMADSTSCPLRFQVQR